ncbi:MAG: hypothetical protein JHD28_05045 [Bacteroidia bacterium]|nr:hypothetical protein [Bacteroidia bacterium]
MLATLFKCYFRKDKGGTKNNAKYAICKYPEFAKLKLKCFVINDWVIAYQETNNGLIIRAIVHGTLLDY